MFRSRGESKAGARRYFEDGGQISQRDVALRLKRVIAVRGIGGYVELTREGTIRGGTADSGRHVIVEHHNDRIVQGPPAAVERDPGAGRTNGRAQSKARLDQKTAGVLDIVAVRDSEIVATEEQGRDLKGAVKKALTVRRTRNDKRDIDARGAA